MDFLYPPINLEGEDREKTEVTQSYLSPPEIEILNAVMPLYMELVNAAICTSNTFIFIQLTFFVLDLI